LTIKAFVERDGQILLMHSSVGGDYFFPGGGREAGETDLEALERELAEECGRGLDGTPESVLTLIERRRDKERPDAVFEIESHYYRCQVTEQDRPPRLEPDELELGITQVWITVEAALATNREVLLGANPPGWTPRETFVLEWLASGQSS
jgi:8-oxo-dGTP pyrophosphatase MutT (NUDIX family)